jgi:tight adherence protein B
MSDGFATMEAIGLLRSGATPEAAWWEAFGASVEPDGAPGLVIPGRASRGSTDAITPHESEALRAAGRLAHTAGAPLADVLACIEETNRSRRRAEAAREAMLAGPRASATVLLWLPVVGWVVAVVLDPGAARILFGTPLGWGLLLLGGALWCSGRAWLKRMIARAEKAGSGAGPASLPLALAEAAVGAGLDVRSALAVTGIAIGPDVGDHLQRVAGGLAEGQAWTSAWAEVPEALEPLERALRSSWLRGASPGPTLRATREAIIEKGRAEAERAAGRLGVAATLPLSLCLLPAFVVVGVMPLVVALASGITLNGT